MANCTVTAELFLFTTFKRPFVHRQRLFLARNEHSGFQAHSNLLATRDRETEPHIFSRLRFPRLHTRAPASHCCSEANQPMLESLLTRQCCQNAFPNSLH